MWSGQAETSKAGLHDMLLTLEPLLRRCLPHTAATAAAAAAAAGSSNAVVLLPEMCIIYNDAAAMVRYLEEDATPQLRETFKDVK
jgi:hypothetical protein